MTIPWLQRARNNLKRWCLWKLALREPGVTLVRRASLRIAAFDCSQDELNDLAGVRTALFQRVEHAVRAMFGFRSRIPPIRFIALGSKFSADSLASIRSRHVRGILAESFQGYWVRGFSIGVVRFEQNAFIERTLLHELVHALLEITTDGFLFPYVLEEGYAQAACESLLFDSADWPSDRWKFEEKWGPGRRIDPEHRRTVRELIRYELGGESSELVFVANLAIPLHRFLMRQSLARPVAGAFLRELRDAGASGGVDVYQWLASQFEGGAAELEESFSRFCSGKKSQD